MKINKLWSYALVGLFIVFTNGHAHELDQDVKATKTGGMVVRVDNETNRVRVLQVEKVPVEIRNGSFNKLDANDKLNKMNDILDALEADDNTKVIADFVIADEDLAEMAGGELENGASTASWFLGRHRGHHGGHHRAYYGGHNRGYYGGHHRGYYGRHNRAYYGGHHRSYYGGNGGWHRPLYVNYGAYYGSDYGCGFYW